MTAAACEITWPQFDPCLHELYIYWGKTRLARISLPFAQAKLNHLASSLTTKVEVDVPWRPSRRQVGTRQKAYTTCRAQLYIQRVCAGGSSPWCRPLFFHAPPSTHRRDFAIRSLTDETYAGFQWLGRVFVQKRKPKLACTWKNQNHSNRVKVSRRKPSIGRAFSSSLARNAVRAKLPQGIPSYYLH